VELPGEVTGPGGVGFELGRRHRRGEGVLQERAWPVGTLLIGRFQGRSFGLLHLGLPVDDGQKLLPEPTLVGWSSCQRAELVFDPEPPRIDQGGNPGIWR